MHIIIIIIIIIVVVVVVIIIIILLLLLLLFILIFLRQTLSQCCSYSVVTIHGAYIASFNVGSIVLLY